MNLLLRLFLDENHLIDDATDSRHALDRLDDRAALNGVLQRAGSVTIPFCTLAMTRVREPVPERINRWLTAFRRRSLSEI